MAALTGFLEQQWLAWTQDHLNTAPLDILSDYLYADRKASEIGEAYAGALTNNAPIEASPRALTGVHAHGYEDDFYYRIHINPPAFDFGNALPPITVETEVWNAYRETQNLLSITPPEGVTLTPDAPLVFGQLHREVLEVHVSADGPPTIAPGAVFDWSNAPDSTLYLTGARVLPWRWRANWAAGIVERLAWKTDVLRAYNGAEQRRALRIRPRKSYEFDCLVHGDGRRAFEAMLWSAGARIWAVPLWHDGQALTAALPAGSATVALDPATRDFRAGGIAIFLGDDPQSVETAQIESIAGGTITLQQPTARDWPIGTMFYPARTARFADALRLPRFTGESTHPRMRFEMIEPDDWTADAGAHTHAGFPVLELRPNWIEPPEMTLERDLTLHDAGIGIWTEDDRTKLPTHIQRMRFTLTDRAAIDAWRRRLHAARGRACAMWVPTWMLDLTTIAPIGAEATAMDIANIGYTRYIALDPNRRDVRIQLKDGTVFYRRISASTELSEAAERLNFAPALGRQVNPGDIAEASFMALARMDADTIELAHWTGDVAETTATLRSFRHDV